MAVTRVRRFIAPGDSAPAPSKPSVVRHAFWSLVFLYVPNNGGAAQPGDPLRQSLLRVAGNRALPVLTVNEPIDRRLRAFLIATVDKFAGHALGR